MGTLCNLIRASHAQLGDAYPFEKIVRLLCLDADLVYAEAFLNFCGFTVVRSAKNSGRLPTPSPASGSAASASASSTKNGQSPEVSASSSSKEGSAVSDSEREVKAVIKVPKKDVIIQKGLLLTAGGRVAHTTGPAILEAFKPFYQAYGARDPLIVKKFEDLKRGRADLIFGSADPVVVDEPARFGKSPAPAPVAARKSVGPRSGSDAAGAGASGDSGGTAALAAATAKSGPPAKTTSPEFKPKSRSGSQVSPKASAAKSPEKK